MPTYDYKCQACGHTFDIFQYMSAKPLKKCPECGKMKLIRLIGAGAGIIFKGSGFYETDYKKKSGSKPASPKPNSPCQEKSCPQKDDCPAAKKKE